MHEPAQPWYSPAAMQVLLDADSVTRGLRRIAGQLLERHHGAEDLLLVGVRRGGVPVAEAIHAWLQKLEGVDVPVGSVDITLYRDDAATALPNPRIGPSQIPGSIDGKRIVLVDDVLFTGRTVRAAIDALLDYGRPRRIELAVVVDRGGRELPFAADYFVHAEPIDPERRVDVIQEGSSLAAMVQSLSSPTIPPRP